jgi:chemotaxis protein CheZ
MPVRTEKKFRIEIQQAQYLAQQGDNHDPVSADPNLAAHRETLLALDELKQLISANDVAGGGLGSDAERIIQEKLTVEAELKSLSKALDDTKREIAGLRYSATHGDRIVTMSHQLDAIVDATEDATNNILAAAEAIDTDLQRLQKNASDEDDLVVLENLGGEVIKIFEACNFQDLTGQRVTKVVEALKHVETRVDAMIKCLGGDEEALTMLVEPEESKEVALEGPQQTGEGISQADIDSMFD